MAIDTAAKRYSMMSFGGGGGLTLLPAPDGTISTADMQHLLGCYSGISFATTSSDTVLTFDRATNGIQVNAPRTVITIQELTNLIREYEDEWESMAFSAIIKAAGKDALGGGVFVGITLTLLDPWEIFFEARPGPDVVECFIRGGNLVATDAVDAARPAMRESPFTFVVIEQSTSAALIAQAEQVAGLTLTQFLALKDA